MQSVSITLTLLGLLAVAQVPLTMMVGLTRAAKQISFLDGGDDTMLRRMRAHGNFVENVPMALLVIGAAEWTGAPNWMVLACALSLVAGRSLHAWSLLCRGPVLTRAIAMLMTLAPMAVGGLWLLAAQLR
ncbi:hypothetical protein HNQ51_000441 [Inhella inkyongensis]|uniref:MAPEG family protein n=1 Tax=Inhella inkyongensis TaxID=392593 RepID=A0A840S165_9BURK|nr:MAPEG family protein [Inhella inkyongensis]MBB5203148.1 hypothetical protein [Inhella inkyongensis]